MSDDSKDSNKDSYTGIDDFYRRLKEIAEQREDKKVVSLEEARKKKQEKSNVEVTPELSIDDRIDDRVAALFAQVEQRNREHKERLEKERLAKNKKTLQEYRIFPKGGGNGNK